MPVEFSADHGAALERRWAGMPWARACESPCSKRLRPDFEYRVAGEGIVPSPPFVLQGPTTITARTGYRDTHRLGVVMVSVGVPLLVLGSMLTLVALDFERDRQSPGGYGGPPAILAGIGAGLGAAFTIGGIYALSTSSTSVEVRDGGAVAKYSLRF